MLNARLSQLATSTRGRVIGADVRVTGVTTDSRHVRSGDLFVALKGDNHDGHDHVASAASGGAAAALVARPLAVQLPQLVVADTLLALGDLARDARTHMHARVIGVTGSNGKTTVKSLVASILGVHGKTHASAGNFNNEIGLPLTLLAMPPETQYAVLEMGAGKPGDIAYLASIARPHVGLVNTVTAAHLERMGSLQGIAQTKGAIYTALPDDGVAIINADNAFAGYFTGLAGKRRIVRFGLHGTADVHAVDMSIGATTNRFTLCTPQGQVVVTLPLGGRHNVANALAATAIACALDVPLATIATGLAGVSVVAGRLAMRRMPNGWTLIDDSYNANPGSVDAAIDVLLLVPGEHWLVLGDMAELGPAARDMHAAVGKRAREQGVDRLYTLGAMAQAASVAFGAGARHFANRDALVAALHEDLHAGVTCVVKGSRVSAMERVVASLDPAGGHHAA